MAKSLPIPQYAGRMPIRQAGARPQRPSAGALPAAWGGALRQTGGDIQDYQAGVDKRVQAQGEADLETGVQNAKLQDMIRKRELAIKVQAAKERWENSKFDVKMLEQKRADEQQEWKKEDAERKSSEETREENTRTQVADFEAELNRRQTTSPDTFSRKDAETMARARGISGNDAVRDIIDANWPMARTGAGDRSRFYKQQVAMNSIQYLEDELQGVLDRVSAVTKQPYEVSRIIQDPYSLEREIMDLQKEARKIIRDIHKAKAAAGRGAESPAPGKATGGVNSILQQIDELEAENMELEDILNQ
jgi:hypothetical protein